MSVHDWIKSFQLGEARQLPANVTASDVCSYGWHRFGYVFVLEAERTIKRVCPECRR